MRITCYVRKLTPFLSGIEITAIIRGRIIISFNRFLLLLWCVRRLVLTVDKTTISKN